MSENTTPVTPLSPVQEAALRDLSQRRQPTLKVNTAQSLIRRGLVDVNEQGDMVLTDAGRAALNGETPEAVVIDFPEPNVPEPTADDETSTEDKAKAKRAPKSDAPAAQTLRIPEAFADYLRTVKGNTAVKAILKRVADGEPEKDASVRIEVSDDDLHTLLAAAKDMLDAATTGTQKRVANGRIRWIDRMFAEKRTAARKTNASKTA